MRPAGVDSSVRRPLAAKRCAPYTATLLTWTRRAVALVAAAIALRVPSTFGRRNASHPPSGVITAAAWNSTSHPRAARPKLVASRTSPVASVTSARLNSPARAGSRTSARTCHPSRCSRGIRCIPTSPVAPVTRAVGTSSDREGQSCYVDTTVGRWRVLPFSGGAGDQCGAWLDLAPNDRQGDRTQPWRAHRATYVTHLRAALVVQRGAGVDRFHARRPHAAQMLVHVTAEVHARHRLLSDVTALRVRDRVQRVEVRLLRDGVVVHVHSPLRATGFDARDVPRLETRGRCASGHGSRPERGERLRRHDHLEPVDFELRNLHEAHRHPIDLDAQVRIRRECRECRRGHAGELAHDVVRGAAEDAEVAQRRAHIGVRRDARVDELPHHPCPRGGGARGRVDEHTILLDEDAHVGDDLPLRRECGGVAPLSRGERGDVVGDETGHHLRGTRAGHAQSSAMAAIEYGRTVVQCFVFGRYASVREHDAPSADVADRRSEILDRARAHAGRSAPIPSSASTASSVSPSSEPTAASASSATCAGAPTATVRSSASRAARMVGREVASTTTRPALTLRRRARCSSASSYDLRVGASPPTSSAVTTAAQESCRPASRSAESDSARPAAVTMTTGARSWASSMNRAATGSMANPCASRAANERSALSATSSASVASAARLPSSRAMAARTERPVP